MSLRATRRHAHVPGCQSTRVESLCQAPASLSCQAEVCKGQKKRKRLGQGEATRRGRESMREKERNKEREREREREGDRAPGSLVRGSGGGLFVVCCSLLLRGVCLFVGSLEGGTRRLRQRPLPGLDPGVQLRDRTEGKRSETHWNEVELYSYQKGWCYATRGECGWPFPVF